MTLKSANLDSACQMGEQHCSERHYTDVAAGPLEKQEGERRGGKGRGSIASPNGSTRRRSTGLLLRKGVWHIEGEASFAFWNAVDPSMEAPGETSCFARSRKQMERFTVVRNTYSKRPSSTSYRAIP